MQRRLEEKKTDRSRALLSHATALIRRGKELFFRFTQGFWDLIAADLLSPRPVARTRLLSVLLCAVGVAAFTLTCTAAFPLRVYPVPLALTCAVGGFRVRREGKTLGACSVAALPCAGALLSCFWIENGALLFIVALLSLLARLSFTGAKLTDGLIFRLSTAFCGALLFSLCELVIDPQSATFLRLSAQCLCTPVLCFLFCGAYVYFSSRENRLESSESGFTLSLLFPDRKLYLTAAELALLFCLLYALRGTEVLGISPALLCGALIGLFRARAHGACEGAIFGTVAGLAASGNTAGVLLGVFCFFGGLLFCRSLLTGLAAGFLLAGGYLLYFAPAASFSLSGADLFLSAALFYPLCRLKRTARGATSS